MPKPADLRGSVPPTTVLGYPHAEEAAEHHQLRTFLPLCLPALINCCLCMLLYIPEWLVTKRTCAAWSYGKQQRKHFGHNTLRCGPLRQTWTREPDLKEMRYRRVRR